MAHPSPTTGPEAAPGPAAGTTGATATYVFAVCRRLEPAALAGLPGLNPGRPVRALRCGPLTAAVQDVASAEYTEQALRSRLSDPRELERCARAHHEVVSAVAARGPAVPLALATLYRCDERAREALSGDRDRFLAALRRIEGRVEWGVKVYLPPAVRETPGEPDAARSGPGGATGTSGRAYLDRRRDAQRVRERRHQDALRAADGVDGALRGLADAARRLRPHGQQATGERHAQILNAAYLVSQGRTREVMDVVEALRRETGLLIEVSGPWVPYSFAGEASAG